MEIVNIPIDREMHDRINRYRAKHPGMSKSDVIVEACEKYLEKISRDGKV